MYSCFKVFEMVVLVSHCFFMSGFTGLKLKVKRVFGGGTRSCLACCYSGNRPKISYHSCIVMRISAFGLWTWFINMRGKDAGCRGST